MFKIGDSVTVKDSTFGNAEVYDIFHTKEGIFYELIQTHGKYKEFLGAYSESSLKEVEKIW